MFKVSELFYAIQGEGRFVGAPSIFLRMFGCNLRCPSFGLPKGVKTTEVQEVIRVVGQYTTYDSLPLVATGCDSYPAVYPEFKHLSPIYEPKEVADKILNLLPEKQWRDEHLVITGGEPLLYGWQKVYSKLLGCDSFAGLKNLTFETNGTQPIHPRFAQFLENSHYSYEDITFSVSPKLSCSGEQVENTIQPGVVSEYCDIGHTYLKFVVSTMEDVNEALEMVHVYKVGGFNGSVYLMPVGGTLETYNLNAKTVAEIALKHGLCYSPRLHVDLFGNQWGC